MISETGDREEEESIPTKGVGRGGGVGGLIPNPMPGQCIFCGSVFKNNEDKEKHEKEVHNRNY